MDEKTRPWYTIEELNEWADKYQNQEWRNAAIRLGEELSSVGPDGYYNMEAKDWLDWAMAQNPQGRNSLAQKEQGEPVSSDDFFKMLADKNPNPFPTQQRTWVGLTESDRRLINFQWQDGNGTATEIIDLVEAKLKEKNT
jgi:hypothetical protein